MSEKYKKSLGQWGEKTAEKYLLSKGCRIIDRHWQKREGEIDLIACDNLTGYLVFIEVKTRTSETFGRPEEAIDQNKKIKLDAICSRYVQEKEYAGAYRLDVIIIIKKKGKAIIRHLINVSLE